MALTLPYPGVPTNGQPLDATPVLANQNAIVQAIQSFDGSQIQATTIQASSLAANINPITRTNESSANFVVPGGLAWSLVSGLQGTMTAGVVYIQGIRVQVSGIGSNTFIALRDTYVDFDYNGNVTYVPVANGATGGMTLTANSIRIAKVVTNGSAITSIVQYGWDPIGNPIYNTNSMPSAIGYAQITSAFTAGSTTNNVFVDVTGLSTTVLVPPRAKAVKISFKGSVRSSASSGQGVGLAIADGSTVLDVLNWDLAQSGFAVNASFPCVVQNPSAGLHTYNIKVGHTSTASISVLAGSGGVPAIPGQASILVEVE